MTFYLYKLKDSLRNRYTDSKSVGKVTLKKDKWIFSPKEIFFPSPLKEVLVDEKILEKDSILPEDLIVQPTEVLLPELPDQTEEFMEGATDSPPELVMNNEDIDPFDPSSYDTEDETDKQEAGEEAMKNDYTGVDEINFDGLTKDELIDVLVDAEPDKYTVKELKAMKKAEIVSLVKRE